jgi:ribosomal protein S18 acetylase RimI-like enzyme
MGITIRSATKNDLPQLGELFSKVYTDKEFDKFTPPAAVEYLEWLINRCPELAFVAEVDKRIIGGYLAAIKPWFDGPHVVDGEIFVDERYRQYGIGLKLTKTLLQQAKETFGAVVIEATVFNYGEDGQRALDWHKSNGREIVPEIVFISGSIDEVLQKVTDKIQARSSEGEKKDI